MSAQDKKCCGCYGPQGPQGIQGFQGPQGPQGVPGQDGTPGPRGPQGATGMPGSNGQMGTMGPVGPIGPMGPQGLQGLQGIPGKDCDNQDCGCCDRFFNVYASLPQVIGPYSSATDTVVFDKVNIVSDPLDFDLSLASSTGDMKFLKHGIYHISWQLQARIVPPVPDPVPSWSFGFWVNGVLMPGSIYSGFTQAPGDDACHSTGDVQFEMKAGDTLRLRNTSVSPVNLNPAVTGSVFPITIASVVVECLKELP